MWLLESDGDVLKGKRVWLRPGKTYLFGRTHSNSQGITIDHSTISRKHATITVGLPEPGDVSRLATRSGLKIEDLKSKHGTFVRERKLSGESITIYADETLLRFGAFGETFSIKWHSVVFTFKPPSRDKDKKALQEKRKLLEPLDIKAIDKFDPAETTHVVSIKRNTPQVLQALVNARYVVDESILTELEYVTTADNLDEPESMSRLEVDFDGAWPDPLKFVPPPNKEPNPKPPELFKPDEDRGQVFRGYTFVMFDKKQYDGLAAPIAGGRGRVKLHELKLGESTSADIIRCLREEFDAAESINEGSGYGVLHVRFVVADPELEAWATRIQNESITFTGQGLVEQNEFLEAILSKDARMLVKTAATQSSAMETIQDEPEGEMTGQAHSSHNEPSVPPCAQSRSQRNPTAQASRSASDPSAREEIQAESSATQGPALRKDAGPQSEEPQLAASGRNRRNRVRGPAKSAFQGFVDDAIDVEVLPFETSVQPNREETPYPQPQSRIMQFDDSITLDDNPDPSQTPRKRPLPPDLEEGDDMNARLYPAQAAAKRRKIEAGGNEQSSTTPTPKKEPFSEERKVSKINPEARYDERMRSIRKKQEEIKDDELVPMHNQLEKMSFREKQNLVRVAEMDVKPRTRQAIDSQASDSRWNEAWNGRKNFKGFRRKGQPATVRSGPRIIIGLEPIKVMSATEEYLAAKQTEAELMREERRRQAEEEESEESESYTDANTHQEEVPAELRGDGGPEIIDIDAPRITRGSDRESVAAGRSWTNATTMKRPASTATGGQAKKKRLNLKSGGGDDSSDEDEIPKFRFKKK